MLETPTGSGQGESRGCGTRLRANVVLNYAWRDLASLLTSATQEELGRAGERNSWSGGVGGEGSAGVAGDANGFEIDHFRVGIGRGAGDSSFKVSDAVGWQGG